MRPRDCSRRDLLAMGAAAAIAGVPGRAVAQEPLGREMVRLWPGLPPGAGAALPTLKVENRVRAGAPADRIISGIGEPCLDVRRPANPTGAGMLVIPGGGYRFGSYDRAGTRPAAWLNARGVTAFILSYRLPGEGWAARADVPLQDAQRAIRLIRRRAAAFGVAADRIGALGFSAGGHVAGSLATRADERVYRPVDAADELSARPDLAALIYPVVTLTLPLTHRGSRDLLLGPDPADELALRYSIDRRVTAAAPPVFLVHARDDRTVPVQNSLMMYQAMLAADRPVSMHLFEAGGHGFGVNLPPEQSAAAWPELLASFAKASGLMRG